MERDERSFKGMRPLILRGTRKPWSQRLQAEVAGPWLSMEKLPGTGQGRVSFQRNTEVHRS